jgi:predicted molibdopterin-dependent oxidoreductase YjgC
VTHRCLTCSKNYRCELQATCEMVGSAGYEPWVGEQRTWYQTPQPPADRGNPFMEFDPQMCIICTRCVRACDEKRHTGAITLSGRGWDAMIAFGAGGPIHESNCDFSGACIDVCPTATLMEHPNKWVAKPEKWTSTTCDSCAVGCSIRLGSAGGRGVIVRPGDGNAFSGDQICVRGRYHYDSLKPRERLSKHLLRRGNIQAPATLAETAAEAARLLREAKGRGRVGVLVGGTVTNEEALAIRELARALGATPDQTLGPVVRAVKGALEERFGTWRMAANLERLPKAKAIVTVADDIEESHNVVSVRIKDAVVWEKAKLVVIGPLRSELVDFAAAWIRTAAGEEGLAAAQLAEAVQGGTPGERRDCAGGCAAARGSARGHDGGVRAEPGEPGYRGGDDRGRGEPGDCTAGRTGERRPSRCCRRRRTRGDCSTRASALRAARTRSRGSRGCWSSATTRRCGCRALRRRSSRSARSWWSTALPTRRRSGRRQ